MNYNIYTLSAKEWIILGAEYFVIITCIAYLFYDSFISTLFLLPFFILFVKFQKKRKNTNRKEKLKAEFLKALGSIATSLAAGISPENSVIEASYDMERLFGKDAYISVELGRIVKRVSVGESLEGALEDFARKTAIEEIKDFALIFSIAKRSGSSYSKIISRCVDIMETNQEIKEESKVLIRGKQYEQGIMIIVPIGIILYLRISSGNYIAPLYHNALGICIMTGCLLGFIISIFISYQICEVEI